MSARNVRAGQPASPRLPLFRDRHEPSETISQVNDALDLIEAHVGTVLKGGGEVALRARLARLLPAVATSASDALGEPGKGLGDGGAS